MPDCTGHAVWSDGSLFDAALVPEMQVIVDGNGPVRHIKDMMRLDDVVGTNRYHYLCELMFVKL